MTLFNIGVACLAARLTIHLRDIAQLIPFITRIIFYMSGIFFLVDRLGRRAGPAPSCTSIRSTCTSRCAGSLCSAASRRSSGRGTTAAASG